MLVWFEFGLVLVWFGLVWFGLVWYVLVWLGLVGLGLVWFGLVLLGLGWVGLGWVGLVWFGFWLCAATYYTAWVSFAVRAPLLYVCRRLRPLLVHAKLKGFSHSTVV